jgi:hypothetical protein
MCRGKINDRPIGEEIAAICEVRGPPLRRHILLLRKAPATSRTLEPVVGPAQALGDREPVKACFPHGITCFAEVLAVD